ncbi:MAG: hypothetical protein CBC84_001350 [Pelagibacteraceae bacterium TMED124]|nr:hypothetical protein [Candidatus Neomarinimicrobiota bacterium]RPG18574.1 MAG: hypothetical protein CBC84_001350 [Pelagibacteraceae bacterium TMED124]
MNRFILALFSSCLLLSNIEFNNGPYGEEYFDIAAPFTVQDLNSPPKGDINNDFILNIQDIIFILQYILGINQDIDWFNDGDINDDNFIDVNDIIIMVDSIINGYTSDWVFSDEWNGNESYIFFNYTNSSSSLIASNNKEELLSKSPMNVHYFFISDRSSYMNDINNLKSIFDTILSDMPVELQNHWQKHLHFIPVKTSNLPGAYNWLKNVLYGEDTIAIDRFQRIRETGSFSDPVNFVGRNIDYLAYEAIYFNSEFDNLYEPDKDYDEITIFERELYSGWWNASISKNVNFPSNDELLNYAGMSVELLRGCPDCGLFDAGATQIECGDVINYSDSGCDDYDRIARLYICDSNGENCYESARWITPFARQPHHLTDISPLLPLLIPGGDKVIKFQESGWPNSLLTLKFRFYKDSNISSKPKEIFPIWNGTVLFDSNYGDNRPATIFNVPENATKVEFVSYITGHGWGNSTCYNCAEFCNSRHIFSINGGVFEFDKDFPEASLEAHCMSLDMISEGTIPNQYGTWGYGRAGWCPGLDVDPIIKDITNYLEIGDENIIDYDACRVSGASCVTPPSCGTCGYCPEIAMSSYIVIYY